MPSNCLFFSIKRFIKRGGYLIIRRSKHGPWLHFMWSQNLKDGVAEHFVPDEKLKFPAIKKILFTGRVEIYEFFKSDKENG